MKRMTVDQERGIVVEIVELPDELCPKCNGSLIEGRHLIPWDCPDSSPLEDIKEQLRKDRNHWNPWVNSPDEYIKER